MQEPVMRADEEESDRVYKLSAEQKKAMVIMAVIQLLMIVITYGLFAAQMITGLNIGFCCIATIIIFLVVYLNFLKLSGYIADSGIKVGWIKLMRILSPILYFIAFILCILTLQ